MKPSYTIFGAGSFARLVADYLVRFDKGVVSEFVVDDEYNHSQNHSGITPINWSELKKHTDFTDKKIIFAVGYQNLREKQALCERICSEGANLVNLCLTDNIYGPIRFEGRGNILLPGASVEPEVHIGTGNILWSGCHICHNVSVRDFNFFAAKSVMGGNTYIGSRNFFGFSVSVRDHVKICDDITLGMGAACTNSLEQPGTYLGIPAMRM